MRSIATKKCVPCESGMPPLDTARTQAYLKAIHKEWRYVAGSPDSIERVFIFKDFAEALKFVDAVGRIAEEERHHPDIDIRYNKVRLSLSTHAIKGLSENVFILAAKIDCLCSR